MFKYKVEIYEDNGWQELGDVALPITDGEILNDTLDEGRIDLKNTARSRAIKPFTRLRIGCYENDELLKRIQRVVGTARRTRKRNTGTALYDWSIQTLELTKLLERDFIGSMTSTKYLAKDFMVEQKAPAETQVKYYGSTTSIGYEEVDGVPSTIRIFSLANAPAYKLYYPTGTIIPNDAEDFIKLNPLFDNGNFINPSLSDREVVVKKIIREGIGKDIYEDVPNNKFDDVGVYAILAKATAKYEYIGAGSNTEYTEELTITWKVTVYSNRMAQGKTITSVVDRLLKAGVTRRFGIDAQKYTLNSAFAEKYASVEAPEMSFSNSTLLDALFQVGGAIHAIPRLQVNEAEADDLHYEVTFDELGGDEEVGHLMPQWVSEDKNIDINDFCDTLDSPSQNLVNSVNVDTGCVTEFGEQYISVRTENNQAEISGNTMAISVTMPIQQLVKLVCLYEGQTADITAFVYEMAEYNTLSSLKNTYFPYSKNYALCYSIGGNTITGLNSKPTTATAIDTLNSQYAIVNILNAVLGTNYDSTGINYSALAFRTTYVPIVSARVTQKKPIKGNTDGNTLVYNQGANLVETSAYGQKMRGAIARLGLEATQRTYDFASFDAVPKVGQKIDGEYIVQVDCAYYPTKIRATLLLTPNFNQISQYVGLNTNYRLYDISERQSVDRFIAYGEIIEVGEEVMPKAFPIIDQELIKNTVKKMFGSTEDEVLRITTALTIPYDGTNEINNRKVLLPVASFAFGQSLAFASSYLDNYGAGYQATDAYNDGSVQKRVQRLVPYANEYGEFERLAVYWRGGKLWGNYNVADENKELNEQAYLYPEATEDVANNFIATAQMSTKVQPFIVMKDSAERIGLTYQVHFQANRESVVIGRAMSENCPLVTDIDNHTAKAYCFNHELNNLSSYDIESEVNSGNAWEIQISMTDGSYIKPTYDGNKQAKAWAVVDENGHIYIGENTDVAKPIYITIT